MVEVDREVLTQAVDVQEHQDVEGALSRTMKERLMTLEDRG